MTETPLKQRYMVITSSWEAGTRNADTLHDLTSIPLSTIYKYIKKLKDDIPLNPLPRSGRPKKLSPKQRRHLGQLVSVNKFSTSTEFANILNAHNPDLNVSNRTVLNELHNMQYRGTVPKSIPLLTTITTDCFREIIQKEWEGIETETFVNLVRSMSRRLEDVIAGNDNVNNDSIFGKIKNISFNNIKGLYLYGGVRTGKAMLICSQTYKLANSAAYDPIPPVSTNLANDAVVLCFDEFQVTDIADAMILRRLFECLFERGVVIVTTSNWHPDDLYKNGIQHDIPLNPLPRSGRPKKLSPKQRRHLGQLVSVNKFSTSTELANILNAHNLDLNVSNWTVLNELHNMQYRSTVPKSIPLLTTSHKQNRVAFAIKYRKQNWNKVIFSDETTFQIFRNTQKVFYKIGTQPPIKAM
ncbi:1748_t:CDS:2, partial [Entrophospora sp. SA101]